MRFVLQLTLAIVGGIASFVRVSGCYSTLGEHNKVLLL